MSEGSNHPVIEKRNDTRSKVLGGAADAKKILLTINGAEVEVRQPSMASRARIMRAGTPDAVLGKKRKKGAPVRNEILDVQIEAVIACTFVPGTNQPVFDAADRKTFMELPSGSWADKLFEAAMELINVDVEEAEKNSDAIQS